MSKWRPAVMNISSYLMASSSSAASSPIASKSPGVSARWILKQVHSTQLQRLKWDYRIYTLAGWRKSSSETCLMRKTRIQKKIEGYGKNNFFKDLIGIDGGKTEFVWKLFPRFTTIGIVEENLNIYEKAYSVNLKNSKDESSLCWCLMKSSGEKMTQNVSTILLKTRNMPADFPVVISHFGDQHSARRGIEPVLKNQTEDGTEPRHQRFFNRLQNLVTQFFEHPVPLQEERLIYENTVRSLPDSATMTEASNCFSAQKSVNQLSVHEFIAHWSKNLDDEDSSEAPSPDDLDSSGTLYAIQILESRQLQSEDYNVSPE